MHQFLKFIFGIKLYMFRTVPLSIIKIFFFTVHTAIHTGLMRAHKLSANLYVLLCVQWKTPYDGQRNCPKHVEFYSKNKFEKLVHLVGFVIRIFHDARSPERQKSIWSNGGMILIGESHLKTSVHLNSIPYLTENTLYVTKSKQLMFLRRNHRCLWWYLNTMWGKGRFVAIAFGRRGPGLWPLRLAVGAQVCGHCVWPSLEFQRVIEFYLLMN